MQKVCEATSKHTQPVTDPILTNFAPSWDPDGRYLYLLSTREFEPKYDNHVFNLTFPVATRPYLILLRRDLPNPFLHETRPPDHDDDDDDGDGDDDGDDSDDASDDDDRDDETIEIHFGDITRRLLAFPVAAGTYTAIAGLDDDKVWWPACLVGSAVLHATPCTG